MHPHQQSRKIAEQVEALWHAHRLAVTRIIARRARTTVNDPDVEDAVAAAFERILRHLEDHRPHGGSRGWVLTIAWHEYLRLVDSAHTRHIVWLDDQVEDTTLDDVLLVEELLLEQTTRDAVHHALGRLSDRQRTLLLELHQGFTYRELMARHHLTWTQVNRTLVKALARLRRDGQLARYHRP